MTTLPYKCSSCGASARAGCNCGVPYVPAGDRAAAAVAANPKKSDRAIAAEIGVGNATVSRARRKATVSCDTVVEKRTGKDGKARKQPSKKTERKPEPQAMNDAEAAAYMKALPEWQAAIQAAWLLDHPGKTVDDYEIAGSCSDSDEGERAYHKWFDKWMAREGDAIDRELFGYETEPTLAPVTSIDHIMTKRDAIQRAMKDLLESIKTCDDIETLVFFAKDTALLDLAVKHRMNAQRELGKLINAGLITAA
jgi:hypothetical protein